MIRKHKWLYIFIALTLIFTSFPFSAAQAVSGSDVEQLFKKFDTRNNGNWYKDYNNENGALAWDESYVMRGYLEMYQATKDTKYLDKFIVHGDSVLKQRDSERGVKDYRGLSLPAWRGGPRYTGDGTYKIFDVHTAMIAYPFAQFATMVYGSPSLSSYKSYADKYLKAAKDAVAVHDWEWTETATEMYLNRPFNMTLSLGSVFLEIYRASGDVAYKNKGVKVATYFKNNWTLDSATGAYMWKYMKTGSYGWEDLSHGAVDIDFAYLAYQTGIYNATDMQRFGNTIQKKLIKSDGTIANRVDGSGTSANQNFIGLWLNFHTWAPSLFDTAYKKVSAVTTTQGEDLLSAAFLNRVYREKNGGLPDPEPVNNDPQITPVSVDGQYLKGQLALSAQVSGDNQTAKVTFAYGTSSNGPWTVIGDAALTSGTEKSGTWSLEWLTQDLADGNYWVRVTAVDDQGAESQANLGRVIKDTVAPQIAKKAPEANEVVQTPVGLSVTFSEPVQNVTVNNLYIEGVTGQVKYDAGTKTAVFTPAIPLKEDTAYKAVVTSGITDGAGNALAETTWTFKTAIKPPSYDVLINGNFTSGKTGWAGTDVVVKTEANGNQYGFAPYGWAFYQDLKLAPGAYKLNGKTLKGTATAEARVVVMFIDGAGNRTVAHAFNHKHKGTGWEAMAEQTITVPESAVTTRIYLQTNGGSGAHGFDDISLTTNTAPPAPAEPPVPPVTSLMVNGDFTGGTTGWSGKDVSVKNEANGNKYGSAIYGWDFYQDLKLAPGTYKLNGKTKKGTSATEARIVVMYIDGAGKRTVAHDILKKHAGTGWEAMPEQVINVPKTAVTTRIYLLTNGGTGYHNFDDITLVK